MTPPNTITIKSDGNCLEFAGMLTESVSKKKFYQYLYTKSESKLGETLSLTESELEKLIKVNTP